MQHIASDYLHIKDVSLQSTDDSLVEQGLHGSATLPTQSQPSKHPMKFTKAGLLALASGSIPTGCRGASLANFALQKVLTDGSEIFGTASAAVADAREPWTATWMKHYPDATRLVDMNIPGTHETATWNFSAETRDRLDNIAKLLGNTVLAADFYRCQTRGIAAMLEAGIRFFDLRYALDATDTSLAFWHGAALLSEASTVEHVLYGFFAWLDAHPSETVILSFQYMGGTKRGAADNAAVRSHIARVLTSPAARRYLLQTRDALGSLGAARGRAILFRRFDVAPEVPEALPGLHLAPALWPDNGRDFELVYNAADGASVFVEDYYEPNDLPVPARAADAIAAKLAATTAHLDKAAAEEHRDALFVTFASAEYVANRPPLFPSTIALGDGTNGTTAGGVNHQLLSFLRSGKMGRRLGIVVLDFFDEPPGLVEAILEHGTEARRE